MNVTFKTKLRAEKTNGHWTLLQPLVADVDGALLVVPPDFKTDFASVPRLPLAYLLAGNTAHASAVLHDFLYETQAGKDYADQVFLAAMKAEGVAGWRRTLMYAAVRAFGGSAYEKYARA